MLKYNLNKQGDKNCKGNEGMVRKNIKYMNNEEVFYVKKLLKNVKNAFVTKHAINKDIGITEELIKDIINNKQYKIIDYDYFVHSKEERVVIRSKKSYKIQFKGIIQDCYIKFTIAPKDNVIVTVWGNRVSDEPMKQNNLKNRYYENFDIINKKVRLG